MAGAARNRKGGADAHQSVLTSVTSSRSSGKGRAVISRKRERRGQGFSLPLSHRIATARQVNVLDAFKSSCSDARRQRPRERLEVERFAVRRARSQRRDALAASMDRDGAVNLSLDAEGPLIRLPLNSAGNLPVKIREI
jgi:hypothetical protein